MATAIVANFSASVTFDDFKDSINPGSLSITLSAQGAGIGVQNIGTTAEDVDYGDLTSAQIGMCFLKNLDSSNFITWGKNNTGTLQPIGKLMPGEWAFFRLKPSEQLMAQADTAACNLEKRIYRA